MTTVLLFVVVVNLAVLCFIDQNNVEVAREWMPNEISSTRIRYSLLSLICDYLLRITSGITVSAGFISACRNPLTVLFGNCCF